MARRAQGRTHRSDTAALFAAALLVAVGGLVYELILGTAASYLIGDSILSFSLATGMTLFGMGVGSLIAARIRRRPAVSFAVNEILLGVLGGNSVLVLYASFNMAYLHWLVFTIISVCIGILVGLEIPLLVKMFQTFGKKASADLLGKILAVDYFGALVASFLFPLLLLPYFGLMRSAYFIATLNIAVAILILVQLKSSRTLIILGTLAAASLAVLFVGSGALESAIDRQAYRDPIVFTQQSSYQKIVVTKYGDDTRLFLNGHLQFSSLDEARYHESLAAAALSSVRSPQNILIMGGGDGMLAREVLRYSSVQNVVLVDIDPAVTELAKRHPELRRLNNGALRDGRVVIKNEDAFNFAFHTKTKYDAILIDLVDPSNERLSKLYSQQLYKQLAKLLTSKGVMITQATSSFFTPHAFETIAATARSVYGEARVFPFSVNVPSFGEWGFVLATTKPSDVLRHPLPRGLRYQTKAQLRFAMLEQPPRLQSAQVSTILHPRVITAYTQDMKQWRY